MKKHMLNKISSKIFIYITPVFLFALIPSISFGSAVNFGYLEGAVMSLGRVIDVLVPVLVALALALFIWGLVIFITQSDNDQGRAAGKQKMIWGIIALFVIVSVWGLVNLLQQLTGVGAGAVVAPVSIF
jgi:hypothetical protein